MAEASRLCGQEMDAETLRLATLRDRLFTGLTAAVDGVQLNGPALDEPGLRLPGNLNCRFEGVDGEALMLGVPDVAMSSGSACTSVDPAPSHVLAALGLDADQVRTSLRFGLGRFNTEPQIDAAIERLVEGVRRLRKLGGAGLPG